MRICLPRNGSELESGGKGLQNKNTAGKIDNTVDNYQLANNLGVITRIAICAPPRKTS